MGQGKKNQLHQWTMTRAAGQRVPTRYQAKQFLWHCLTYLTQQYHAMGSIFNLIYYMKTGASMGPSSNHAATLPMCSLST